MITFTWKRGAWKADGSKAELKVLRALGIPGVTYNGLWIVAPNNALEVVRAALREPLGIESDVQWQNPVRGQYAPFPREFYEYQQQGVTFALSRGRVCINDEMGLGKTPQAIIATQHCEAVLVVCPAIVRQVWAREFARWAPRDVEVILPGKLPSPDKSSYIVSYEMAGSLKPRAWSAVILDEAHYIKTLKAQRSRAVRAHLEAQDSDGMRIFLTGTPLDSSPVELWGQLDALEPACWGTEHEFKARYCAAEPNTYAYSGVTYRGINEEFAEELAERLRVVSIRRTKAEVAHLLPPITVEVVPVTPEKKDLAAMLEDFARPDKHRRRPVPADLLLATTDAKVTATRDLLATGGARCTMVLCHLRRTAQALASALEAACITGDMPANKRHAVLDAVSEAGGVCVATMHSLSTGLSLTAFTRVIYAELDWRVSEVTQSMARYHRVSSTEPVFIQILAIAGTIEEKVADAVFRKLGDVDTLVGAGMVEGNLAEALEGDDSDLEFLQRLKAAAASFVAGDAYG